MPAKETMRGGAVEAAAPPSGDDEGNDSDEEQGTGEPTQWPFVVEDGDTWVFTLQYPIEAGPEPGPEVLRVRRTIYARDVRKAARGDEESDALFYLAAALTGVPERLLDRLDARDYTVLSSLVARISLGNSRAVLQSLGGRRVN